MEISLCMIVKNEEQYLDKCLESVHNLVEEIVIVDTGSTDRTVEIASKYTPNIFYFEWIDDFSAARNYAFSKGTKEYLMVLDADECFTIENKANFMEMKRVLESEIEIVLLHTMTTFRDMIVDQSYQARIYKKKSAFRYQEPVHEYVDISMVPKDKMYLSPVMITHMKSTDAVSDRNLRILGNLINQGKGDLRKIFYYASELCMFERSNEAIDNFNRRARKILCK